MRKQTEISLVEKRPHLFHSSILNALGIAINNQASSTSKEVRLRWGYKEENFFECGEGWLQIIAAFMESLDHYLSEHEIAVAEDDPTTEKATVFINGAMSHQQRLYIMVDMSSNIDELLLSKIRAMQEFSAAMSGFICEVCSTSVKEVEPNSRVQCAVCRCSQA
ncbi:MAG: hypothetical protein K9J28_09015 [Sulfuritalea sp.]|nr:hypothetical protein [Sulfuritalea sp.]